MYMYACTYTYAPVYTHAYKDIHTYIHTYEKDENILIMCIGHKQSIYISGHPMIWSMF